MSARTCTALTQRLAVCALHVKRSYQRVPGLQFAAKMQSVFHFSNLLSTSKRAADRCPTDLRCSDTRASWRGGGDTMILSRTRHVGEIYISDVFTSQEQCSNAPPNSDGNSAGVFRLVARLIRLDKVLEHPHTLRQRHAVRHGVQQASSPRTQRLDLSEHPV